MKKAITGEQFRREFKNPKPGAYLFFGDENFLKHRELESLRTRICPDPSLEAFNHILFTRDNYSPDELMNALLTPPMGAGLKLIELYELPFAEYRKKEDSEGLTRALEAAAESVDTVLLIYTTPENFDAGEAKSPSATYKLIAEYALPVAFEKETGQRLVLWVQKHFTAERLIAEPGECAYLIDAVGRDMMTLRGEIEKLTAWLHAKERDKLEKTDIDFICPRNVEFGAFAFADAILDADNDKAFRILGEMKRRNEPAQMILGSMNKLYTDLAALKLADENGLSPEEAAKALGLHPYVAKIRMAKAKAADRRALEAAIDLLYEADEMLKTSSADEYILLERMISQGSQIRRKKVFS